MLGIRKKTRKKIKKQPIKDKKTRIFYLLVRFNVIIVT